jgi:hypothetical protein
MKPEDEQLHPDVVRLVQTGQLPDHRSKALEPAFQALGSTSTAKLCDLTQFPCELLVAQDFMRTIKIPPGSSKKQFVCPRLTKYNPSPGHPKSFQGE